MRNPLKQRTGTITGRYVQTDDGKIYELPVRGNNNDGYPEVLIDATAVGGKGWMHRQSIKPYIGMKCTFTGNDLGYGFNFIIIKS